MFFPAYKGKLRHLGDRLSYSNYCFKNNTLTFIDRTEDSVTLELSATDAKSYLCNDIYLFFTSSIHQVKMVYFKGIYHITINDLSSKLKLEQMVLEYSLSVTMYLERWPLRIKRPSS